MIPDARRNIFLVNMQNIVFTMAMHIPSNEQRWWCNAAHSPPLNDETKIPFQFKADATQSTWLIVFPISPFQILPESS